MAETASSTTGALVGAGLLWQVLLGPGETQCFCFWTFWCFDGEIVNTLAQVWACYETGQHPYFNISHTLGLKIFIRSYSLRALQQYQ
jgi:hypothetical protein